MFHDRRPLAVLLIIVLGISLVAQQSMIIFTAYASESSPSEEESFDRGGIDWIKICNDLQTALVSSCDVLVNPDNTLTTEGERAVGCIRNSGTLLMSLPLPLVIAALQILEPTGCGGIVEWGLIGNVSDLRGIINQLI